MGITLYSRAVRVKYRAAVMLAMSAMSPWTYLLHPDALYSLDFPAFPSLHVATLSPPPPCPLLPFLAFPSDPYDKKMLSLVFPLNRMLHCRLFKSLYPVLSCPVESCPLLSCTLTLLTYSIGQIAPRLSLRTDNSRLSRLHRSSESEGSVDEVHVIVNRLGKGCARKEETKKVKVSRVETKLLKKR